MPSLESVARAEAFLARKERELAEARAAATRWADLTEAQRDEIRATVPERKWTTVEDSSGYNTNNDDTLWAHRIDNGRWCRLN